tara:strand:+ start:1298 stop:1402 length:105 start_codon:yes stop_codon:yes gene_type:complete
MKGEVTKSSHKNDENLKNSHRYEKGNWDLFKSKD